MFNKIVIIVGLCIMGTGLYTGVLAGEANQIGGKFGVSGNVGYSMYAMDDIYSEMAGPGISVDVSGGLSFNGGLHYALSDQLQLGVEAGVLQASHTYEWEAFASYKNDYNLPAIEAGLVAKYMVPVGDNLLLSLGAGLGLVTMDGTLKFGMNDLDTIDTEISGSTIDIKLMAGSQIFLNSVMAWNVDLGYRMAKITDVTIDSTESIIPPEIESVDYSGLFARTGIMLYF